MTPVLTIPGGNPRVRLSILCPVFNESVVIPLFFGRIEPVIRALRTDCDVDLVFLDNCSTDGSREVIQSLACRHDGVFLVGMSRNVGYQGSLDTGLRTVQADLYAIIDVDCEDPPEMLVRFLEEHRQGFDIVYGERVDRDEPPVIKTCRRLFYRILRRLSDDDIVLDMAEFSLFTREVRDAIIRENSSFPFVRAAIARVGFRRRGLPYKRERRIAGTTHYNLFGMSLFAVAGILASSTLLLRLPIYLFPLWCAVLAACGLAVGLTQSVWAGVAGALIAFSYLGFTAAATALYVARTYKNGLMRPNASVDRRVSLLPPPS